MPKRRYTILIADRTSGVVRRVTVSVRPVAAAACALAALPVLIGVGAAWRAKSEVATLYASHQALDVENMNYRSATGALADQISSLQSTITELGSRSALDPALAKAMEKLPAFVKNRAMGGGTVPQSAAKKPEANYARTLSALANPDDTFGLLRSLLDGLESRLDVARVDVENRNALAAATPSIWPVAGWLSSRMGARTDPVTGDAEYHHGLDIAGDTGQPVHASGAGTVQSASYQGGYGNLVVIDHGFGLQTRYGHLSGFNVKPGTKVKRGDLIGRMGATGKATGTHLHYEVLANGRLLNPLQLLTQQKPRDR